MTHDLDEDTDLAFERAEARADQAADREYHDSLRRNVFGAALVVVPMTLSRRVRCRGVACMGRGIGRS